jgi:hypothetical protein
LELSPPSLWSPNGSCRLVEAADGWLAINLARAEDREAVPAWLQCSVDSDIWSAIIIEARKQGVSALLEQGILLGLPIARVGETTNSAPPHDSVFPLLSKPDRPRQVIDLSALWAGPLCGGLLAGAGMEVSKVESPGRPDPTRSTTPQHDQRLNGLKRRITMALDEGALLDAIAGVDILITSARAHALDRLGLAPDIVFARNPKLIWVAISAYGFDGSDALRVGFGDDAAAAGGLLRWQDDQPCFLGDALADPLTGLRAARLVFERVERGQAGLIDVALARTAAYFADRAGLR